MVATHEDIPKGASISGALDITWGRKI